MESHATMYRRKNENRLKNRVSLQFFLALFFAFGLAAILVACGSKGEPQPETTAEQAPPAEETTPVAAEEAPAPEVVEPEPVAETITEMPAPEPEPDLVVVPPEPVVEAQNEPMMEETKPSALPFFESTTPKKQAIPPNFAQDVVNLVLDNVLWEDFKFEAPDSMKYDQKASVRLSVNTTAPYERMNEIISNETTRKGINLNVVAQLEANLKGENFQIGNIVPETQSLITPGNLDWQWDVKPTRSGKQDLHATVKVTIAADGDVTASRLVKTFDKSINVIEPQPAPEPPSNKNLWMWVVGIIGLAIASIIAVFLLKPKKDK